MKYSNLFLLCLFSTANVYTQAIGNILNIIKDPSMQKAFKHMLKQINDINFTQLIKNRKYDQITIEKISRLSFYFQILFFYAININNKEINVNFTNYLREKESSFKTTLTNLLLNILDKPFELKKEGEKNNFEPIFELLHLVADNGLTLLDFVELDNTKKEYLTSLYYKLIISMINTYNSTQNESFQASFESRLYPSIIQKETNNYTNIAQDWINKIYKTMSNHNLKLSQNLQNNKTLQYITTQKMHELQIPFSITNINNQLKQAAQKLRKKEEAYAQTVSFYKEFLYDYDFHADVLTVLHQFSVLYQNYNNITFDASQATLFLQNMTSYLNIVKDCPMLDTMQERSMVLHYKDFLIRSVQNLLNKIPNKTIQNSFNPEIKEMSPFSDERIDHIAWFINNWLNKKLKRFYPSHTRTLLFYADLIEQVYTPSPNQWQPLEENPKKKALLIYAKDNVFAWWQRSITHLYGNYFLSYVQQLKSMPYKLDSLLFSLSSSSWLEYVKKHYNEDMANNIAQAIEKEKFASLPKGDVPKYIADLKQCGRNISASKLSWFFVRLINKKNVLDVVEGEGILKTLNCLNNLLNTFFEAYTYQTNDALDKTLVMIREDLTKLQKEIFYYLKAVVYAQKPTSLNEAYIKTGKALINAVQKTIDLINKKLQTQELKTMEKEPKKTLSPFQSDFTTLDKQFNSKKVFIQQFIFNQK